MELSRSEFKKYLFICENERAEGGCCMPGGAAIREALKAKVKAMGLDRKIRVSRSGCLDLCSEGPSVLLMPDNVWFKRVAEKDTDAIIERSREGV